MSASENDSLTEAADLSRVARQFSVTFAASIVSATLGFVLTLMVARGLGAEGSGVFFVTVGVFAVTSTLLKLGADLGAMRMIASHLALGDTEGIRTILVASALPVGVFSAIAALVFFMVAPEIAPALVSGASNLEPASLLRAVMAFLPFATVSGVIVAATRGFGTMAPYIVVDQLGVPLLSALGVGVVLLLDPSAMTLLGIGWALPTVIGLTYAMFALGRLVSGLQAGGSESDAQGRIWREFWRFASVRAAASIAQVLVRWLDIILVGALASVQEAGIYAAVSRLLFVGTIAQRAIIRVLGPRFSALLALDDRARAQTLYQTATAWLVSLSFPFYLLVSAFASVVVLLFGREFESGAGPLAILSLAMLINVATGPATTILLMAGKASWNFANSWGSLTINAALNLILIPPLGMTGAAIAWCASILVQNVAPTWQIFRFFGLHPLGPGTLSAGGASLIVFGLGAGIIQALAAPSVAAVVAIALGLSAVYAAILWRFRHLLALGSLRESIRLRARKSALAEHS